MSLKKDISWINNAKGIGIVLVVLGHMTIPDYLSIFIYSFHMPLFFILSGIVFNQDKYCNDFKTIVFTKAKSLLWPFLTFTLLAILLNGMFLEKPNHNITQYFLESIGLSIDMSKSINTPLWYLTALFSVELIYSQLLRVGKYRFSVPFSIMVLCIIGVVNLEFGVSQLPFNLNIALLCIIFFFIGSSIKPYLDVLSEKRIPELIAIFLSCLLVTAIFSKVNGRISVLNQYFENYFLFYLVAVFGSGMVIFLSMIISKIKFSDKIFNYLGVNSLIILSIHTVIPSLVRSIGFDWYRSDRILSLVFIWLSIEFIRRYMPIFLSPKLLIYNTDYKKNI